jgi:glycosyltransferase involved in cell wall biosynthesis
MRPRLLFLQCTNAAYYPPILNAAKLAADAGWRVTVLSSTERSGSAIVPGRYPGVRYLAPPKRASNAIRQLDFVAFLLFAVGLAVLLRPKLIYASDPLAAGPALLAARLNKAVVVYHEHDGPPAGGLKPRLETWRAQLARRARLVITPNRERGRLMQQQIGFTPERLRTVWNLPRRAELPPFPAVPPAPPLILYFHGSITPDRLPRTVVRAVLAFKGKVILRIGGYEAPGARGYVQELVALGRGTDGRALVNYIGPIAERPDLLAAAAHAHVGLALMPLGSDDVNMRHMAGASNKPFDYMAAGLPVLVSDLEEWRDLYVAPGYGLACDPDDAQSIIEALRWFLGHGAERHAMAARARAKIEADWNYDTAFAPILAELALA